MITRLRVDFPRRYVNNDCCDSPDARKLDSPDARLQQAFLQLILLCRNLCFPFDIVFCQPKQVIESFKRHVNIPIEEV